MMRNMIRFECGKNLGISPGIVLNILALLVAYLQRHDPSFI